MRTKALPTLAVIGCGDWGKNIVRTAHDLGVLGAICDARADQSFARALSEKYGVPVRTADEVLQMPEIDGVLIATPTPTHYELAKRVLQAKKHVLVEKPLVKDQAQNEELIALAKKQGRHLMVGHLLLYHPAFTTFIDLLKSDAIGSIRFATSRRTNLGKVYPYESALWDLLPHDLSMVLTVMQEMPVRVLATEKSYIYPGIGDTATIELEFPNNKYAEIYLSRLSPVKEQKIVVTGAKGMLTFDDTQEWLRKVTQSASYVEQSDNGPVIHRGDDHAHALPPAEPLRLELTHFIDSIAGKSPVRTSGTDALDVLKVILAAEDSIRLRKWVDLS